jgi:hypothetical protein
VTIGLASSLPSVAAALGISTGILPPGVTEAAPLKPPKAEDDDEEKGRAKREREGAKREKEKERKKRLKAVEEKLKATVANGILTFGAGTEDERSAPIAELAKAAGVAVKDLCWPVVAARGTPQMRYKHCPPHLKGKPGYKGAFDTMCKRPDGFGEKLASIFGGPRNGA